MGASYSHVFETYKDPNSVPNFTKPPTHDPLKGFPRGRKKRELIVSKILVNPPFACPSHINASFNGRISWFVRIV